MRFHCDSLVEPSEGTMNSKYSVEMINAGKIAWLRPDPYSKTNLHIFAGTTMQEFFGMIKEAGGEVYLPCELGDE